MIVLGIDPGTAVTGYGVVKGERMTPSRLIECGIIRTRPRDSLANRLQEIHTGVVELIQRHRPDALSIEDVFYARNVRTTVVLGHARGVILLAAANARLIIAEYPPAEIKKAVVGTGSATKEQVQFMVTRLLRLKSPPQPADAADGVAAALAYIMSASVPSLIDSDSESLFASPAAVSPQSAVRSPQDSQSAIRRIHSPQDPQSALRARKP